MNPELACAVLSLGDEPTLVDAVRSVLAQDEPVEIVVVNSGGGDPAARLAAAGIDVLVIDRPERLYPGAVRNLGIAGTRAPFVSFLAADCLALPGWAAGRLREHRAGAAAVASRVTNAHEESTVALAALLVLHHRLLPYSPEKSRLFYGLSYDRTLFRRYGLFREDLRAGEDTEFNARIRPHVPLVYAADVQTAHRYPTRLGDYVADTYRRGRLQAAMLGRLQETGPRGLLVAARAVTNVAVALGQATRTHEVPRGRRLRATPLLVLGGLAHGVGGLTAYFRPYDGQELADVRRSQNAAGQ